MNDPTDFASDLLIEEQYEYAIYLYTNQIEEEGVNGYKTQAKAYLQRATCYLKMHKYQDAINDIQQAIIIDRLNPSSYKKLAKCYAAIGDISKAKQAIVDLLSISTDRSDIQNAENEKENYEEIEKRELKAKEAYNKAEYEKVIELMNECLEKSQICNRHKILKAECFIYLRRFDEALTVINEILFTNKDDYEAIYIRGLNLIHQQKYKLGLEDLKLTINHLPKAKIIYKKYIEVEKYIEQAKEMKKTNINEAKNIFQQLLNIDLKNLEHMKSMYLELSKISCQQKKYNEAMLEITNAFIIEQNDIQILKMRAKISMEMHEYSDAIEDYVKIIQIGKNDEHLKWLQKAQEKLKENKINHYKILGVPHGGTKIEIAKAWKKLALIYHPDKLVTKSKAEQIIGKRKYATILKSYEELIKIV